MFGIELTETESVAFGRAEMTVMSEVRLLRC